MINIIQHYIYYILLLSIISTQDYSYTINYIEVPLDHFSFTNNYTFKLRYLLNDSHWSNDGPIFFYTGNEGNIEMFAVNTGLVWEIAVEFRALIVFAEHRYYGESLPFGNISFSDPKYLGYLSSSQALADYIYLIEYLQELNGYFANSNKNPVVAFGGSYGGMLSAWLRMKYPASVLGAIASSAPILQFEGLVTCEIFNRIITFVFGVSSTHDCPKIIRRSWAAIQAITSTDDGKKWLSNNWKLCKPLQTAHESRRLIDWLKELYGNLAMMNYPYSANFIVPLPANPVRAFCEELYTISTTPRTLLRALGEALGVYTNFTGNTTCIEIATSPIGNFEDMGWDFQSCTELIMPMCSDQNDMFENESWNFTKYAEDCYKKWGVGITRPDLAVWEYGGKDLKTTSNIIFSNGLLDPWSGGGVLNDISPTVLAVIMPDAAHHLDLRASNPADPVSVVRARKFYKNIVYQWLISYYKDSQLYLQNAMNRN